MQKDSKRAKLHHYIPQFYLKGFCDDKEKAQLYCIDKRENKSFISNVKNVASQTDFYKADCPSNPGVYEEVLAKAEAKYSEVLEQIKKTSSFSNNLDVLLDFIAWIYISNPKNRNIFNEALHRVTKIQLQIYQALYDQGKLAESERSKYEELLKHAHLLDEVQNDEYKINFTSGSHFQMAIEAQEEVYELLKLRKWLLLKAPEGNLGFITSDHPAFLAYETKNNVPLGLMHKKTQLYFPISNKLAVVGSFESLDTTIDATTNVTIDATEESIARYNACTIWYSNK
ncbi:DUF4238 domain-containing protein [Candidatus Cyrtobacter comes]|uniref:DUF4238 domain-containing protein n=1 Tax=Candidatus Cyrtobacter comes TaxID=675776 RepID=A0ABU5L7F2_9RICK|nr:DUF4238 domain-containing protein [Candidatus Cyrtobacter comes]MDZ5762062.1 DUF4238 domain-containing protein [Candidatus Cyrtobacter comes]